MNIDIRAVDAWFLARKPVIVSRSQIASIFFGVGMCLLLLEALFFDYFSDLANSSFTTRRIIGFHLFLSELWFIFLGNVLLFLAVGSRNFLVPKHLLIESRPIFLVLGVYSVWFVYGSLAGNSWALQEFREMVFAALSLPPVLFFGAHLNARQAIGKFIIPTVIMLLALSAFGLHNSALIVGTLPVAYFTLKLLYKNAWAVVGLAFASLPFLFKFAKPMIALFAFCAAASFVLAAYLNPKSVNWILSRFKLRIVAIGLSILLALLATLALINAWTDGAIEQIVRWYFLKERFAVSGETIYGDLSGGRFAIWRAALESWVERPFIGYGLGAEVNAYASGWITKVQYHNYLIQALHNTGLIGFVLIIGGWSVWLSRSLRKVLYVRGIDEKIMLASMLVYVLGILFYGLYGHSLSYPPNAQLFWLCIGFLTVVRSPFRHGVQR